MKRLSLAALSLSMALAAPAAAQQYGYAPGQVSFGGSAQFINFDGPSNGFFDSDYTQFAMEPKIGLSLNGGLMIGTGVLFSVTEDGDNTTVGIRPFLRKNSAIADRAGAYAQVAPLFSRTFGNGDVSVLTFGISGDLGVYYFISQKFSLELSLAGASYEYGSVRFDGEEVDNTNNFVLGYFMQGPGLSVMYHF